jgi:hypothetical protein
MSWYVPSSELGLSQPLSHQRVCHTRLRVRGWGSPNSDDWRKSLSLCLLCGIDRQKIRLIESNAKCRYLRKKLTCKMVEN